MDSTTFVIQTDKQQLAEKQDSVLKEQLQKGEIEFFQNMPNNRFLVVGPKPQPENYDYFSNVYRNNKNGMVIILPRIAVMFKHGANLQPVLNKYEGKLVKDSGDKQKYILKCNVGQSEEVLKLVNFYIGGYG